MKQRYFTPSKVIEWLFLVVCPVVLALYLLWKSAS